MHVHVKMLLFLDLSFLSLMVSLYFRCSFFPTSCACISCPLVLKKPGGLYFHSCSKLIFASFLSPRTSGLACLLLVQSMFALNMDSSNWSIQIQKWFSFGPLFFMIFLIYFSLFMSSTSNIQTFEI